MGNSNHYDNVQKFDPGEECLKALISSWGLSEGPLEMRKTFTTSGKGKTTKRTVQWFTDPFPFQDWATGGPNLLWVSGGPG